MTSTVEHVDVLIVGAGLSGIGAACHLRRAFPRRRLVILEARNESGGTWSLFRYPGVRSDSDMFTLGYRFRPWTGGTAIADGRSIRSYLRDTAAETGVDRDIKFGHRVVAAAWDSSTQRWTVTARVADGGTVMVTASFLFCCSGYNRHDRGHIPDFPGRQQFQGPAVHPQQWPEDLDVVGKRVVVIGSGATAMTLAPELARRGAQVAVLQRSPCAGGESVPQSGEAEPSGSREVAWGTADSRADPVDDSPCEQADRMHGAADRADRPPSERGCGTEGL